jgi:hypothetical protein
MLVVRVFFVNCNIGKIASKVPKITKVSVKFYFKGWPVAA